jgi:hypothetical protein
LLTASDISSDFSDVQFQQDYTTPTPCGQPNTNQQFPPTIDVGSTAVNSTKDLAFQQEVSVYKDADTAQKAFTAGLQGVSCGQGTVGSEQATFTQKDVSSEFGVSKAIEIDFQSTSFQGQLFAFLADDSIVTFQFQGAPNADTSTLPSPVDITKKGLQKLS